MMQLVLGGAAPGAVANAQRWKLSNEMNRILRELDLEESRLAI